MFNIVRLFSPKQCVRMVDSVGRQFLELISLSEISEETLNNIVETFSSNCNFCDIDNSPIEAIKIFGTRAAENKAIRQQIQRLNSIGIAVTHLESSDEVKVNSTSNWKRSTGFHSKVLDKFCSEPQIFFCYDMVLVRFTTNMHPLGISQGQMCVFNKLVDNDRIGVFVAPPGRILLPPCDAQKNHLFEQYGWFKVTLRRQKGFVHSYRGASLRRTQFR